MLAASVFYDETLNPPAVSTMAAAMFFGSVTFATVALTVRTAFSSSLLGGNNHGILCLSQVGISPGAVDSVVVSRNIREAVATARASTRSSPLDVQSFLSWYTLLYHTTIFGIILFYAYLCENHPPYPHSGKSYDRDQFFFITALLLVAAAFTLKKHETSSPSTTPPASRAVKSKDSNLVSPNDSSSSQQVPTAEVEGLVNTDSATPAKKMASLVPPVQESTEVLNRDQTEEWKVRL
jgi:10 TM Acyl Transferase domain found in Cas1p